MWHFFSKCFCGRQCTINHSKVASRCCCDGNHNMCKLKCSTCDKKCQCIANHKSNHECSFCMKEIYNKKIQYKSLYDALMIVTIDRPEVAQDVTNFLGLGWHTLLIPDD